MTETIDQAIDGMKVSGTLATARTGCGLARIVDGFDLAALPMVARIGAVAGPSAGELLVARHASAQTFLLAVAVPVLACVTGLLVFPAAQRRIAEPA